MSRMKVGACRRYLLGVLVVVSACNLSESSALGLLLQNIKVDLRLTDSELGILSGIAFALFYSVMGVPIARWADRGNRITVISVTTFIWGVMVALCGVAANFAQLLLLRIGVAVGEAGYMPPSHSLIAEYFAREERARAVAIFALGGSLSAVIGDFWAGWLNELYGWRATFMIIGLPGLVLAAVAWLTLEEPRNSRRADYLGIAGGAPRSPPATASPPDFKAVCRMLAGNRTFRHLVIAASVVNFFGYGIVQWQPAFLIRSFGLSTGEIGTCYAIIYGSSWVGTYWGGIWASRHAARDEPRQLRLMAVLYCGVAFMSCLTYLTSNRYAAIGWIALVALATSPVYGPLYGIIQTLIPDRMRATAIAVLYFISNLVGMGFGPLSTGVLSDALRPLAGTESLRYALLLLCPGYFWAAWHMWRARRTVVADLQLSKAAGGDFEIEPGLA